MLSFLLWYLVISLTGLVVFPLAYRLLPALADRGYSLSRALGLLLWGYLFWLLGSLRILHNDLGGQLLVLFLVVLLSWFALRRLSLEEIKKWLRARRSLVITVEVLFLLAFAAMALVRSANPEIFGTEKPMEEAFINSILHSPSFPPHDPWLSGYGISYYYFGYVLVAMMARITAVPGSVAFNLGIALVFALTALGAYSLVYNLLAARSQEEPQANEKHGSRIYYALLGPLFILVVSNLEGFLEVLHQLGLFWTRGPGGQLTSRFWTWLGILDLNQPPNPPFGWLPRTFGTGNWWWWRASRVISDYDFANVWREIIDEFPAFSYLLADLHPHVLAMPFFLLGAALALNLFLGGSQGKIRLFSVEIGLNLEAFALAAFALGSLVFLNTWDILPTITLFAGAYAFRRMISPKGSSVEETVPGEAQGGSLTMQEEMPEDKSSGTQAEINQASGRSMLEPGESHANGEKFFGQTSSLLASPSSFSLVALATDFLVMAAALGIASFVLYLPFFLGFSSQAGGPLPNLVYITRGAQMWVMFAPLWLPIGAFLLYLWLADKKAGNLLRGVLPAAVILLLLWIASLLLTLLVSRLSILGGINPQANEAGLLFLQNLGTPSWSALIKESLLRRAVDNGGWITLFILLVATLGLFFWSKSKAASAGVDHSSHEPFPLASSHLFVLLTVLLGTLLVLVPEFVFLRDQFVSRINTIFKFYFQAWQLWGIAAAYGTAVLLLKLRRSWGVLFRIGLLGLMVMALTYPVLGFWDKTHGFNPAGGLTLDGGAYVQRNAPDEWAAIQWLQHAPAGIIVEALPAVSSGNGGDYSDYSLMSEYSGLPTVLGWVGHELQWRGGGAEIGNRQSDIEQLYTTSDWSTAQAILNKYDIRYVYIGSRERSTYHVNETKFKRFLTVVFQQGDVAIYEYQ
jgi:YYY domain-containing protein